MCIHVTYHHDPHCDHITTSDPDLCHLARARNKLCPRDAPTSRHHVFAQDHACPDCLRLKQVGLQHEAERAACAKREQRAVEKMRRMITANAADDAMDDQDVADGDLDEAMVLFGSSPVSIDRGRLLFTDFEEVQDDARDEVNDAGQVGTAIDGVDGAKDPVLGGETGAGSATVSYQGVFKTEDEGISIMGTSKPIDIPSRKEITRRNT